MEITYDFYGFNKERTVTKHMVDLNILLTHLSEKEKSIAETTIKIYADILGVSEDLIKAAAEDLNIDVKNYEPIQIAYKNDRIDTFEEQMMMVYAVQHKEIYGDKPMEFLFLKFQAYINKLAYFVYEHYSKGCYKNVLDLDDLESDAYLSFLTEMKKMDICRNITIATFLSNQIKYDITANINGLSTQQGGKAHIVYIDRFGENTEMLKHRKSDAETLRHNKKNKSGMSVNIVLFDNIQDSPVCNKYIEDNSLQDTENYLLQEELKDKIYEIIDTLPIKQQEIFNLYIGRETGIEMSGIEISKQLNITQSKVYHVLQKTRSDIQFYLNLLGLIA